MIIAILILNTAMKENSPQTNIIIAKNFCSSHFSAALEKHKKEEYKKANVII